VTRAAVIAGLICLLAAGAEGLFAGPGARARLATLRQPPLSPPFGVWVSIGLAYYGICFTLLYRLLRSGLPNHTYVLAVGLLGLLLCINAVWNYFFFRRRDLRGSLLLNIPYAVTAIGLVLVLVRIDAGSAWVFAPYLIYLAYAIYYCYATWRMNAESQ
jgi:tryptophan-rich sensory protein